MFKSYTREGSIDRSNTNSDTLHMRMYTHNIRIACQHYLSSHQECACLTNINADPRTSPQVTLYTIVVVI